MLNGRRGGNNLPMLPGLKLGKRIKHVRKPAKVFRPMEMRQRRRMKSMDIAHSKTGEVGR